jgi:general secretion pathway protein L
LLVTGTPESSWLWVSATQGVWGLPFPSGRESLSAELLASAQLRAEPAVAEWAEHQLQRPPSLVQPAQRLLTAAQSDWDLAQFDLAATGSARWLKTLVRMQQTLWQSSAWRPARWGVGVLLLSQLLGLNAWAWKLQADLRQRQAGMAQVMSLTFPEIQVVVDAPLQMRREVERLRQASGQTASDSLESLLAALGQTLPPGTALNQISYEAGELRAKDLALTEAQSAQLQTQLQTQQVQARRVGTEWVFSPWTSSPPRSAP